MTPMRDKEKADRTKRGYTLYLDLLVIQKLEDLAAVPDVDRSPSWLVNHMLKEKLGIISLEEMIEGKEP